MSIDGARAATLGASAVSFIHGAKDLNALRKGVNPDACYTNFPRVETAVSGIFKTAFGLYAGWSALPSSK